MSEALTPTSLATAIDISPSYASQLLSGARPLRSGLAVKIFRATGHKIGPVSGLSDGEIDVLERALGAEA